MLVLTCEKNETIRIGDSIVVVVKRIKPSKVYLAIEAPDCVHIVRDELIPDWKSAKNEPGI